MGCHTWFYSKMKNQPSHDYIKEFCINEFKKTWRTYADLIFHKYDVSKCTKESQEDIQEFDYHYDYILNSNREGMKHSRKRMENEFLEAMESYHNLKQRDIIDEWMIDFFEMAWTPDGWPEDDFAHIHYDNGIFYQECDENYETIQHDTFRVSNYPDTILHSYEEYLEFVRNPENGAYLNKNCNSWEYADKQMKEFWEKFPDGIVRFG